MIRPLWDRYQRGSLWWLAVLAGVIALDWLLGGWALWYLKESW